MEQAISSDLIRGHLDTIILHTLTENDKYAQQISDAICEKSENKYQINQATLYSSLKRLETQKFVSSYWNDADDGRRKYFKITEKGKDLIDKNLSNWSFSRAIIDKLMDAEPQKEIQVIYKEKLVPVQNQSNYDEKTQILSKYEQNLNRISPVVTNEQKTDAENYNAQSNVATPVVTDAVKEANFRNILNGLISSAEPPIQEQLELTALNTEENKQKTTENQQILSFNETISDKEYVVKKDYALEKIDYSDLIESAEKNGFKVNVSSKETVFKLGRIYINKLNFVSAMIMFFVCCLEFTLVSLLLKDWLNCTAVSYVVAGLIFAIYPVVSGIIYGKKAKKSVMKINTDAILISFIVLFNVILICLACNFVFGVDFSNLRTIAFSLILPIALILDALLYFFFRFILSKAEYFRVK